MDIPVGPPVLRGPEPPAQLAGLPRDRRGFLVPAEAGWTEDGPQIQGLGQLHTFGLAYRRACGVCGFPLPAAETVWRLFTQHEASSRRLLGRDTYELANPGHLVCMLYAAQVCPFWSRPEARLGKESLIAPGAKRGTRPALLGFDNYELVLPADVPVQSAAFMYHDLVDDIPFRDPTELAERYETARAANTVPTGRRSYWTNQPDHARRLHQLVDRGRRHLQRSTHTGREVRGPNGAHYYAFSLPLPI